MSLIFTASATDFGWCVIVQFCNSGHGDGGVLEHRLGGVADAEGVAADHVYCEIAQQVLDDRFLAGRDIGLAPTVDAAFTFDAVGQEILGRSRIDQEGLDA